MSSNLDIKVIEIASRQAGIVTRRQAMAAGMTDRMIFRRVQRRRWRRVAAGVYAPLPDPARPHPARHRCRETHSDRVPRSGRRYPRLRANPSRPLCCHGAAPPDQSMRRCDRSRVDGSRARARHVGRRPAGHHPRAHAGGSCGRSSPTPFAGGRGVRTRATNGRARWFVGLFLRDRKTWETGRGCDEGRPHRAVRRSGRRRERTRTAAPRAAQELRFAGAGCPARPAVALDFNGPSRLRLPEGEADHRV